ncbi:PREDICTED: uncharacterized protein LOC109155288 [Ipomoea nil]|uniref:uncharacterized protein LOC109155288 n=1 Tax=Ipomoea nil TaxID=35883 RepID=UPI000900D1CF|nr:PREDICTED: uncharacterized protein LOC109155288 [Ipomoea nil]
MATRADSPSENFTPSVTHRSPEDQDLLERSTKKTKRGRDYLQAAMSSLNDNLGQDSPAVTRGNRPDSNHWRTPLATPIHIPDRAPVVEVDSNDDMEEDGRSFDYPVIKRLQRMWKTEAPFELIALNHDYFLAKFESLTDYDAIKFGGPWMVLDHYLTTQLWRPNFDSRTDKLEKLLAWIRFPSLPIEYFDDDFLKKIGDVIGKPLKIDVTSSTASKGKFARVCVELDITKPLLSRFVLNWTEWPIEYEGIHQICFKCGIYGHRMDMCGKEKVGTSEDNAQADGRTGAHTDNNLQSLPKEKYGSWMLVTRRVRKNQSRNSNAPGRNDHRQDPFPPAPPQENLASQSRFGPLDGMEEDEGVHQQPNHPHQPEAQQADIALPRIRTNYHGVRHHEEQRNPVDIARKETPQASQNRPQHITQDPGASRGFRGSQPNRAAAVSKHTVVQGSVRDGTIASYTVYRPNNSEVFPGPPPLAAFENTFKEVPPDKLSDPPPLVVPQDVTMQVVDGRDDPGAASSSFRRTLKLLLRLHKPSLICLLEPKVSGVHADNICSSLAFDEWVQDTHAGHWLLSMVYGSPVLSLRKKLFADLSGSFFDPQGPWLTVGDFNSVTCRNEVSNPETFTSSRTVDFNDWIFREGLIDLGFTGPKFTWMRGVESTTFRGARLDRALSNLDWRCRFPNADVKHLLRVGSDHSPLLINTNLSRQIINVAKFRFNMAWPLHPSFQTCVRATWNEDHDLTKNISVMAESLTTWNRETFGNVFQRKKHLLARLQGVQRSLSLGARIDLIKLDRRLRKELDETLYQEELIWFQRSCEEWITSGDCNTRFYHIATTVKTNQTKVNCLRDEGGNYLTDDFTIRQHTRDYFRTLFSMDPTCSAHSLKNGFFPTICAEDWAEINVPVSMDEIKRALFDMSPCKAPGPDGITAGFFSEILGNRSWQPSKIC